MVTIPRPLPTLLLIALAAGALPPPGRAAAPETDPIRRSAVVMAVERAGPAVVNISSDQIVERRGGSPFPFRGDPFFDEFFRDFMDPRPRREKRTSLGSGVVVRNDGTILTNEHVILRGGTIHVTLSDGREFAAKLVGADTDSDLAVLRIDAGKLPWIDMGRSDDLMIGETVIAIGNPFGLSHTVTTGVISATGRSLRGGDRTYADFIQTDASINPGNSGGPLLNIKGELIGINTAIYGKAQGIGFAIPVARARRILGDLVSHGSVRRGWLGVSVQDLTPDLARHFGVERGVVVAEIEPGSPAAKSDLARGDVVTRVDGQPVRSGEEFGELIDTRGPGETVTLTRIRDDRSEDLGIRMVEFPEKDADRVAWDRLGLRIGEDGGLLVVTGVRRGSPAAKIGVQRGDHLLGIGGAAVESLADFRRRVASVRGARAVLLAIGRGNFQYNVTVPLGGND
ncbi:MAG: trypsin-like peptidase domain-containing protein [bacterium]|nr:trypsin-like peptidase domain-containing protein [bacterium]